VPEIIDQHIINGKIVDRLLIHDPRFKRPNLSMTPLELKIGKE